MFSIDRQKIGGIDCSFYIPAGEGPFPVVLLCEGNSDELAAGLLNSDLPPALYAHADCVWNRDYSPWPAPGVRGGGDFTGGAAAHLRFIEETLLPALYREYPALPGPAHCAAAGYSLGGLFALWAGYESAAFGAAATLSGSLWFDGWAEYAETHTPQAGTVYLSLGKSEERAGDPRVAAVGDNTRLTSELLARALGEEHVCLEWNRGGHFTGIPNRWQKAMSWLLPKLG